MTGSPGKTFYHASPIPWQPGAILTGRGHDYVKEWANADFYRILDMYRPVNAIAHHDGVFMCDNDDDLDSAGGSTEWVLQVEPIGPIERHDMNWSSAISCGVSENMSNHDLAMLAQNYWKGIATCDPLWEYLASHARVLHCEKF